MYRTRFYSLLEFPESRERRAEPVLQSSGRDGRSQQVVLGLCEQVDSASRFVLVPRAAPTREVDMRVYGEHEGTRRWTFDVALRIFIARKPGVLVALQKVALQVLLAAL